MANRTKRYTLGITLSKETSNPTFNNLFDNGTIYNINDTTLKVYIQNAIRDLVTTDQTQTFTNKTIDADLNTITNIENADIKAGAAIDRSKLASGSANRLVVNDGVGVVSDAAQITANRALISDANGIPTQSTVTSTTLGFLDATSSVQTQLDSKTNASGGTLTNGSIITPIRSDVKKDTLANLLTYANSQAPSQNGQIVFATDTKILYQVVDSNLVSLASSPASGEANTASNLGTGLGLYKQKQLVDLQFKSLTSGTNITLTDNANDVSIATTAEINTASNVGTVANGLFKQKTGVNLEFKSLIAGSNITITPGTDDVTITSSAPPGFIGTIVNVSSSPTTLLSTQDGNVILVNTTTIPITLNLPITPTSGQRFVIKDERGTFGANPVTMTKSASHTIERLNAAYLLEANFGSWTFVFDGVSNWVII